MRVRRRLNATELDAILQMRGSSKTHKDYKLTRATDKYHAQNNYQVFLRKEESEKIDEIRSNRQFNIKRLFFDIETTPDLVYSWRIGHKISLTFENIVEPWQIICICYKWQGDKEVHHLAWNGSDKELLEKFILIANQADELVGHNSDRFDIKKIRTRCIYHRIPAFPKYRSLDTLKKSRGNFDFPSNRLNDIGQFLGVGQKVEHEGFQMWVKVLKGDKEALKKMIEYCKGDVELLERVYLTIEHYIKPQTHIGVHIGEYKYSCPVCGSRHITFVKNDVTQKGTLSRVVRCLDCSQVYNISNKSYMDFLKRKINN